MKLDRIIGGKKLIIKTIEPDDLEDILPIAIDEFVLGEPATQGIDASPNEFEPMLRPAIEKWIQDGISIHVREAQTNKVIAVAIATLIDRNDDNQIWSLLKPSNYKTWVYIELEKLMESAVNVFDDPSVKLVVDQNLLCVLPEFRNIGIGKLLFQITEDLGRAKGCQLSVVETSSNAAERLCSKMGYKTEFVYLYEDFQMDGKKIFDLSKMNGSLRNTIMIKKLQ